MRMSELSATTGVTVPTLKFYLREQLLHAGERTSPNQAQYDATHVERVRLVRALLEVGGLSVAQAARVVGALDSDLPLSSVFGIAQRAVSIPAALADSDGTAADAEPAPTAGQTRIAELCESRGWRVHPNNPGLPLAARVLDTYAALGLDHIPGTVLEDYAQAADLVAAADLAAVGAVGEPTEMTRTVAAGTVLGDALFAGLRRIAQEAESLRRFPLPDDAPAPAAAATTTTEDC